MYVAIASHNYIQLQYKDIAIYGIFFLQRAAYIGQKLPGSPLSPPL